jgi:hypothetical protein
MRLQRREKLKTAYLKYTVLCFLIVFATYRTAGRPANPSEAQYREDEYVNLNMQSNECQAVLPTLDLPFRYK